MPNKENVSTGKPKVSGAVFSAPTGTTLPVNAVTALDPAFKDLGYVSEDGLTNSNSPTKENVKEWGGSVVDTLQTDRDDSFTFTFLESSNAEVLKTLYGEENVTVESDGSIAIKATNAKLEACAWVFDMILKNGKFKRIVVPSASISEVGDITYVSTDLIKYNVTIMAEVDGEGATHYEYISA